MRFLSLPQGYPKGATFHEVLCRHCGKQIIWTQSLMRACEAARQHHNWHHQYPHENYRPEDITTTTFTGN